MSSTDCSAPKATFPSPSGKLNLFKKQHCIPSSLDPSKDQFLQMLNSNSQYIIVAGGTGFEKTTQIPQWCAEWNPHYYGETGKPGIVACTEPRRNAAIAAATKAAEELNVHLGQEIGYAIRFEDRTSEKTILKYCTDGMLLRETMNNPELNGYSVIVLDKAHERSLATDVLLSLLKKIVEKRPDIKIVVISATNSETERFKKFLDDCPVLSITNASHPEISERRVPEIVKLDLGSVVLQLKKMGIEDLSEFLSVRTQEPEDLKNALERLITLEAIDDQGKLTKLGALMAEFPLDVGISKMLITSTELKCSNEILSIIAMTSVPECFVGPGDALKKADEAKALFTHPDDHHLTFLNVYKAFKKAAEDPKWCLQNFLDYKTMQMADGIRIQLYNIMNKLNLKLVSTNTEVDIKKALALGFPQKEAQIDSEEQAAV